jgi:nitrate reductase gamma subunit
LEGERRMMKRTGWIVLIFCMCLSVPWGTVWAEEEYGYLTEKECTECHVDSYYPGGDFDRAETVTKWIIFAVVFMVCMGLFAVGLLNNLWIWSRGKAKSLRKKFDWKGAVKAILMEAVLERRILQQSVIRWLVFITISMGFIALGLAFVCYLVLKQTGNIDFLEPNVLKLTIDFVLDFIGTVMLIGFVIALLRRTVLKPAQLENLTQDTVAVVLLFLVVVTGFLLEGFRIATLPSSPEINISFMGALIAAPLRSIDVPWAAYHFYLWIFHGLISLAFIAYIPYGKILHFIACPISIASTGSDGTYMEEGSSHE